MLTEAFGSEAGLSIVERVQKSKGADTGIWPRSRKATPANSPSSFATSTRR